MNASKENAAKARQFVNDRPKPDSAEFKFMSDFLDAAVRKLPSEAAYAKEKNRGKSAKGKQ